MRPQPIETMYATEAELYWAFSADRDFHRQVETLVALAGKTRPRSGLRFLELFAGPAAHARTFQALGYGPAHAIDASAAMRRLAEAAACSAVNYHLSTLPVLPEAISALRFEIIFAPRFSVGYLDTCAFALLVERCLGMLAADGILVLELHDPRNLSNHLRNLDIHTRSFTTPSGQSGSVTWPYGEVTFSREGWKAELTVRLALGGTGPGSERLYSSTEYLHTADLVRLICQGASTACTTEILPPMDLVFPQAVLTCSRRLGSS